MQVTEKNKFKKKMRDKVKSLWRFGRKRTAVAGNGLYYFDVDSDGVPNILFWIMTNARVEATHIILQYQLAK